MFFGTGCLITDELVLTCAHNFDVIQWGNEKVPYSRIYVCLCDPAPETFFSLSNRNESLIEASLLRRGLLQDNLSIYDEVHYDMVDLAILKLSKPLKNLSHRHEFVKPGFNSPSCNLTSVINSKLYLVCYNRELTEDSDVKLYKYIHGLKNISTNQLNFCHNSNYKSVSVGSIVYSHDLSHLSTYATHTCSTLPGSSGGAIFDSYGNFTGIHIGVANSRQSKNREMFFSNDTYNKYIPLKSKAFGDFINQSVLTNMTDAQFAECWRTNAFNTMQEETYIEEKMINNGQKLIGPIFDEAAQANILHQPAVRVMDKHS
ncbi:unnamed protein product [Adineta ricciae]|uniref:Serine protease n=1 Tax=Adineta ricciae TaxID=249248 RepID=A0A816A8G1_ADIRI|nr:unnamed protein product [Adineta ricciae]